VCFVGSLLWIVRTGKMAKGLWELMEQTNGNGARVWTLQEELLLAHAVMRFGTDDWNAVSEKMEVRAPQWDHFGGVRFSPQVGCHQQLGAPIFSWWKEAKMVESNLPG
jgi:hypothetical protein